MSQKRAQNRAIATRFVDRVNRITVCAMCGAQPIEWHHEDHPAKPNSRVSSLRTQGASIRRIAQEMRACTPLCRTCHMTVDGRMNNLTGCYEKGKQYVPPLPCECCGREVKPRRNKMCVTCDNHHSGRRPRRTSSCDGCCR